jgi:hypothetical protein
MIMHALSPLEVFYVVYGYYVQVYEEMATYLLLHSTTVLKYVIQCKSLIRDLRIFNFVQHDKLQTLGRIVGAAGFISL